MSGHELLRTTGDEGQHRGTCSCGNWRGIAPSELRLQQSWRRHSGPELDPEPAAPAPIELLRAAARGLADAGDAEHAYEAQSLAERIEGLGEPRRR